MSAPDQVPDVVTIYKLSPDVYDQLVSDMENVRGDSPKLRKLLGRLSPFSGGCE